MIQTIKGDITRLDFDIIVNAANNQLLPGGGVCGAIFAKAGQGLIEECQKIGYCPTGQAVLTQGYGLPAKAVIHTVGPVYHGTEQDALDLQACYWNTLSLAYDYLIDQNLNRLNLAFPCVSTGIFGYPHEEACAIAVSTVQKLMRQYPDAKRIHVTFVCYLEEDYLLYKKELKLR